MNVVLVEGTVESIFDAPYGPCRGCRNEIALSRLRGRPQATLCAACIEERLESLSADAL